MIKYNQLRLIIFCRNETPYCKIIAKLIMSNLKETKDISFISQ